MKYTVFILLISVNVKAQENVVDTNLYIYDAVYKNIAAYNIRYCSNSFNGVVFDNILDPQLRPFYKWFLPDHGYKLKMTITKIDSIYPISFYHLYKVEIHGFEFIPDNSDLPAFSSYGPITTNLFLLALNETNGYIKFISGSYFHTSCTEDFKVDIKKPETFIKYLQYRSYAVQGTNIRFWKRKRKGKRKFYVYLGYSMLYKSSLEIKVNRKNPEIVVITVQR